MRFDRRKALSRQYYIVTGTGFATHDFDWIARSIPEGLDARLIDVTSSYAVLSVMGPKSRDLLQSSERERSFQCRLSLRAGATDHGRGRAGSCAPCHLCRRARLGAAHSGRIRREPLRVADGGGQRHGIANAGYRAIDLLRLEKGYRAWGADIGPDHSPLVAGLGWAVKLKGDTQFQGRAALESQLNKRLPRLLAGFTADPSVLLLGRETIYRDGKRVGWLTSGGYGHTIGRAIGYGYVRDAENGVTRDELLSGSYQLEVATDTRPRQDLFRAALRSGDVAHQELNRALVSARRRHCSHKSNRSAKSRDC